MEENRAHPLKQIEPFPWLPESTQEELRGLYWNVVYNGVDAIIVFTGRERFGKSTLAMIVWAYFDHLRQTWGLNKTIDFEKKIAYIPEDYAKRIDESEGTQGDVVFYDEAGTGMYNRESMSRQNVDLNKILMTCGYKNLVHLLNLPNFFALDKEVRSRRVAALFVVTAHPREVDFMGGKVTKLEKGWFRAYSAKDIQEIFKDQRTSKVNYPRTKHGDLRFASLEGTDLWKEYEKVSHKHKRKYIQRLSGDLMRLRRKRGAAEDNAVLSEFDSEPDGELEVLEGNTP